MVDRESLEVLNDILQFSLRSRVIETAPRSLKEYLRLALEEVGATSSQGFGFRGNLCEHDQVPEFPRNPQVLGLLTCLYSNGAQLSSLRAGGHTVDVELAPGRWNSLHQPSDVSHEGRLSALLRQLGSLSECDEELSTPIFAAYLH